MRTSLASTVVGLALSLLAACNGGASAMIPPDASGPVDMCPPTGGGGMHKLVAGIKLTDDGMGVPFFTQNGSTVRIAKGDLVGKQVIWATLAGGEQVGNGTLIDFGVASTLAPDLSATVTTPSHYANGPWELALFVSVTGADPTKGPQPGDIAAFDLTPPPPCQPKVTGTTVRFTVADADATLSLTNRYFIRF